MTRAAPARSLGLHDRGHLGAGAAADITVYTPHKNAERMFAKPDLVFKDGQLVAQKGKIVSTCTGTTHTVKPDFDTSVERSLSRYFDRYLTMSLGNFKIDNDEIVEHGHGSVTVHPCQRH